MNNFLSLMQNFLKIGNPNLIIQNMIRQNPQANAILNQLNNSGLSCKDFVMQYCKQAKFCQKEFFF